MNRLYRRRRNTFLGPKAGNENLLASAFFDRGDKVFVVPGVHGRTLDGFLSWDTARSCGHMFPPKDFISTVVKLRAHRIPSLPLRPFPKATMCPTSKIRVRVGQSALFSIETETRAALGLD